jgi:SAM-dependent methyltransferase
MILPQLLWRFLKHRDDPEFYRMQADDAIRWIKACGVPLTPETKVLDLGCGHGVFGGELLKLGCQVTFADESNFLLPIFKDSPFIPINLDRDQLNTMGQFDLVICSNVLEHLSKPEQFLENVHLLLKPGGRFYLSWTNWLSPWGGHEFSPLHYFGPKTGPRLYDKLGKTRFHQPGKNLFVTYIGKILAHIESVSKVTVERYAPRYYTEFPLLLKIPVLREFLAWNCALLLRRKQD